MIKKEQEEEEARDEFPSGAERPVRKHKKKPNRGKQPKLTVARREETTESALCQQLIAPLSQISRQKLRSVKMLIRRNVCQTDQSIFTSKLLEKILQEAEVEMPDKVEELLIAECSLKDGLSHERLLKYFEVAHGDTGRDSVMVKQPHNCILPQLEQDELLQRAVEQIQVAGQSFDYRDFRKFLMNHDLNRDGLLKKDIVRSFNSFIH
ncbi:hypothetical protein Ciccas_005040 [Cichlidogyrus casuarinus]|uniref:EF-hand domain-containing protein n=1 Tax=Cichlidogyrus casuarinus TaxID=1844966 RepID=A0ABD2Q9S7_9PLAT